MIVIEFDSDKLNYVPGEGISGTLSWNLKKPPVKIDIDLLWYTEGKGDKDVGVVDKKTIDNPQVTGTYSFSFIAPEAPYSFSGKLISLIWAIEASTKKGRESSSVNITISDTGSEVLLEEGERTRDYTENS
jgi:hypothetical protein